MIGTRRALWILWASCAALLGLELVILELIPSRPDPWYAAQTSVAGFVLALLALLAGVGTFTLRESLVGRDVRLGRLDPRTPAGFVRVRSMLLSLWALCLLIGLLGCGLAYGAGTPRTAWPYALAAAGLLVLHAPRRWLFEIPPPPGGPSPS